MESAWAEMGIEINDRDLNPHKRKGHICWYYAWIGSFQESIKLFKLWEILQMLFLSLSQYHTQSSISALQANKHCCNRCLLKDKFGFQTTGWHIQANSRWVFFTSTLLRNIKSIEGLHMMCSLIWCYLGGLLGWTLTFQRMSHNGKTLLLLKPRNLQNLPKGSTATCWVTVLQLSFGHTLKCPSSFWKCALILKHLYLFKWTLKFLILKILCATWL